MQDKRLGRGLDYLLNMSTKEASTQKNVEEIDITKIRKNRFQPRDIIEDDALQELMSSIKENGVLQPILVKQEGSRYELIAGERRFRACQALGKKTVPAIALDVPENKLLQLAIIENIQREDLNPIEEAKAYHAMLSLENITHEELSKRVGKKRSTVTNLLRLLELPEEVQEHVSRGTITQGHARTLLCFPSKTKMLNALKLVLKNNLSVRELERLAKSEDKSKNKTNKSTDPVISSYEETLKNSLKTKINIHAKGNAGFIKIHYYSNDDFVRLYKHLTEEE